MRLGDLPGPAGETYLSWLRAVERPVSAAALCRALPSFAVEQVGEWLDFGHGAPICQISGVLESVLADMPRHEVPALMLADAVLARRLGWDHVVPLLAAGLLPGVSLQAGRHFHCWTGVALLLAVAVHVVGLWITSPSDMVDALTFTAPTAFSAFGVVAMWALIGAALLASTRRKLSLRPQAWRLAHTMAASVVVVGSVAHAILIEGTMGTVSKTLICALAFGAWALTVGRLKPWRRAWRGWQRQAQK
jgi:hypothetical protein